MIRKKYEQKQVEFRLSDKKVPAQNEAFQDLINRQFSCLSESSSLLKCKRIP